jgi:hypothetical protein
VKVSALRLLPVIALLSLASCSQALSVFPTGSLAQPTISVSTGAPGKPKRACVDHVAVFEQASPRIAIWQVRSGGGDCVMLDRIVYGQTPQGFIVDTSPAPLKAGVAYEFSGHGWTTGLTPHVPWYGGGRSEFRDGVWRPAPPRPSTAS